VNHSLELIFIDAVVVIVVVPVIVIIVVAVQRTGLAFLQLTPTLSLVTLASFRVLAGR